MRQKTYLSKDEQISRTLELYLASQGLCEWEPVDKVSKEPIGYSLGGNPGWRRLEFPRLWQKHRIAVATRRTRYFLTGDLAVVIEVGSNSRGNAISVTSKRHVVKNFWTSVSEERGLLRIIELPSLIRELDLRSEEFRTAIKRLIS
jgi:hypothetical protein